VKSSGSAARGLPATYRRLQAELGRTDWVALGSVIERNKPGQGGPRYQWSRRVEGKTVTVALSAEQFAWLREAIANQRRVWAILERMHRITLRQMWKTLPSTSRRKLLSKSTLGIN
jgi:hypothetical protein